MNIKEIPDRVTIRLNDSEKADIVKLSEFINENDISKIIKFGLSTSINHIKNVTNTLVNSDWDVIFQRKRKTQELKRKLY